MHECACLHVRERERIEVLAEKAHGLTSKTHNNISGDNPK